MENPVGLRFRPTDEEIVELYLRPKNLDSNTSYVDRFISTICIRSFDPWNLPSQSRIKLKDQVWFFFSGKDNKYDRGERQIRKTKSGFWKITGKPKDIMRKSGNREKIGEKRVLMFYMSKTLGGSKSDWVMHEYHLFSLDQMMMYTICKVKFKGDETEMTSSGSEIEHSHSLIPHMNSSGGLSTGFEGASFESLHSQELQNPRQFSGILDEQQETLIDDAIRRAINKVSSDDLNSWLVDDENSKIVSVQQDCSDLISHGGFTCERRKHRKKKEKQSVSCARTKKKMTSGSQRSLTKRESIK